MRVPIVGFAFFLGVLSAAWAMDGARLRVVDGDTVVMPSGERVRLVDIDAPETFHARCPAEMRAGAAAKARLADLLRGQDVDVRRVGRDRYRRTLALVSVDGRSVGAILVQEGLALRWQAGRKAKAARAAHWCG